MNDQETHDLYLHYGGSRYSPSHVCNVIDRLVSRVDPLTKEDAPLVQSLFSQVMIFRRDYDSHTCALVYELLGELPRDKRNNSHHNEGLSLAFAAGFHDVSEGDNRVHEVISHAFHASRRPLNSRRVSKLHARNILSTHFPLPEPISY